MVSGAVTQLMALSSSPHASLADVARCLKQDPGLSTRVLTLSNSAAFATNRQKIVVVEDAVRHIGVAPVQKLAASIGVLELIEDGPDQAEHMRR
jgi:HD-like signal output (HDOD) protein